MNIYQVVNLTTRKAVATGFDTREQAKPTRDEFNAKSLNNHIVSRGTDHPRGPSFGPIEKW